MKQPILLVMAAGLGSRYGGLKQMDAVGNNGEWIIDFSLFDAYQAGFRDVVFIVSENILEDFKASIGARISGKFNAEYVIQRLEDIPEGQTIPDGRTKPWGTAHAVYSARKQLSGCPFMAINADDYYGPQAFKEIFGYLAKGSKEFAMVSYQLKNTVTDNGHVARGICVVSDDNCLMEIVERTNIQTFGEEIKFSENGGESWQQLADNTPVSLNCWGFTNEIIKEMDSSFPKFLDKALKTDTLKAEYFLPSVVEEMIRENKIGVKVLQSKEKWYGVTYHEDKDQVSRALNDMKHEGKYPHDLWK